MQSVNKAMSFSPFFPLFSMRYARINIIKKRDALNNLEYGDVENITDSLFKNSEEEVTEKYALSTYKNYK